MPTLTTGGPDIPMNPFQRALSARLHGNETVAVIGAGPIGLAAAAYFWSGLER